MLYGAPEVPRQEREPTQRVIQAVNTKRYFAAYFKLTINQDRFFSAKIFCFLSLNIVVMPDNLFLSFVIFLTTYVQVNWCSSSRGSPTVGLCIWENIFWGGVRDAWWESYPGLLHAHLPLSYSIPKQSCLC